MNELKIKKEGEEGIDKPVKVKGIQTEGIDPTKKLPTSINFETTKTPSQALVKSLGERASLPSSSDVRGTDLLLPYGSVEEAFAPVDLARAIPDAFEREAFIDGYGSKMVNLLDQDRYGIRFEKDLVDIAKFREQKYHRRVKEFVDELDENQGFMSEMANTTGKFLGKLSLNVSGLTPFVYGVFSGLVNWDFTKVYDNSVMDAWEYMDHGLDRSLPVYGGSDVWKTENGKFKLNDQGNPIHKEFLVRFMNDPIKTIDADVAPAAAFVVGAVITEILAGALAVPTGGTSVVVNTARLAAQATRLAAKPINYVGKGMRLIRGMDKLKDLSDSAKLYMMTQRYRQGLGLVVAGIRTSAYESTLIARSTQDRTMQKFLHDYHVANGGEVDANGMAIGKLIEPSEEELRRYERLSGDAGDIAFKINVPLVAGMNFIQMPRLFFKNWKMSGAVSRFSQNTRSGGTRVYKGVRTANVDANKYIKYLGYTTRATKGLITEAWEEYAQGSMEEGLIDYFTANYGADAAKDKIGFVDAMSKAGSAYLNTVEGRDSVTIGGLMGLVGVRIPGIKIDPATGRYKFGIGAPSFGGARSEMKEYKKKINKARENAESLRTEEALQANFKNYFRHIAFQQKMDSATEEDNAKKFKDAEHASLFSGLYNRESLGLGDTVLQDLDALDEISLDEFNHQFGTDSEIFTEESKRESIAKSKTEVNNSLKAIREVKTITTEKKVWVDKAENAIKNVFKTKKNKVPFLKENILAHIPELQEQMSYLYSAALNAQKRGKELESQISEDVTSAFSLESVDEIVAKISAINTNTRNAEFKSDAAEVSKAILAEWKVKDSTNYNLKVDKIKPILQDLIQLKIREAEASSLYKSMFTSKGIETFVKFSDELQTVFDEQIRENLNNQIKDNTKKSKNPGAIARNAKSENTVFGNTTITNGEVDKSTRKALKEYQSLNEQLGNEDPSVLADAVLKLLDTNPGFFALIKSRLAEKGIDLEGINSVDGLKTLEEAVQADYTLSIFKQIEELQAELNQIKATHPEKANLYSFAARSQPVMEGGTQSDEHDENPEETVTGMFSGEKVGSEHIIINTHDKQFDSDNKPVRDSITGKFVENRVKEQDDYYVIDNAKINNPDFLPNSLLQDESSPQFAIFRISQENPWNLQATADSVIINVFHKDSITGKETFIGDLNRMFPESPAWLLQLRQDIIEQEAAKEAGVTEIAPNNSKRTNEILEEKTKVKQELEGTIKAEKELKALEEEKSELESNSTPQTSEVEVKKAVNVVELQTKLDEVNKEIENLTKEKPTSTEAKKEIVEEEVEEKNTLTEKKVEKIIKKETTKEDVAEVAKEENVTEEEAEELIKTSVLAHIKEFGNKLIKAPKTRLKKIINKIIKSMMALIIGGTLIVSASSFSMNNDGNVTFSLANAVENLLPDTQTEWTKRFLDKNGLITIQESHIEVDDAPIVKVTPKPEKIFEIINVVLDKGYSTDSLMSYRSQWDNADGFRYIPTPVRQDADLKIKISGVVGVGHFLLDGSVKEGKTYTHEYSANFLKTDIKNNKWIPVYTRNADGSVNLKYKRGSNVLPKDIIVSPLRQHNFSDIDWNSGEQAIKSKSGYGGKNIYVLKFKNGEQTSLPYKVAVGKDVYGRFSGASMVFIFNDKHGNTIVRDFAGSLNQIEAEGISITKQYELKPGDLTMGYHDMGSFSAKPKAEGGTIAQEQWEGFNTEGMVGGALLIPIEGNIQHSIPPVEKESGAGALGLTLLAGLASVRKKRKEGKKITPEDIEKLNALKDEITSKISELEKAPSIKIDDSRLKEVDKEIENLTKQLAKTDIKALKDKLAELNKELVELSKDLEIKVDLESDPVFASIAELADVEEDMTPKQKKEANKKLEEQFGKEKIKRAKAINDSFEDIIAQIGQRQINMFFKEGEQVHCK